MPILRPALPRLAAALVCAVVLAPAAASAQQAYIVENSDAVYEPVGANEGTTLTHAGDADLYEVALPFAFRFFSRPYEKVWVSVNGGVTFLGRDAITGQPYPLPDVNAALPSVAQPQAVLAAVWDDWKANENAPGGGSRIAYAVRTRPAEGDDPGGRVFVVDWQRVQRYGAEGPQAATYSFQLLLHEGTDRYEVRFGPQTGIAAVLDATSGAENHLGTVGVTHPVGQVPVACSPYCGSAQLFPAPSLLVSPNQSAELVLSLVQNGARDGGPVIEVLVQNLGMAEAEDVTFDLYLSTDSRLDSNDRLVYSHAEPFTLAARPADRAFTVSVPVPDDVRGARYVIGVVDPQGRVEEQNKANNVAATPDSFVAGTDLTMELFGQAAADIGGRSTYNARLTNRGVRDAAGVRFRMTMHGGTLVGARELHLSDPIDLPAETDEMVNFVVTMPDDVAPGTYALDAMVDPQNAIVESDETNNRIPERLQVEMRGADVQVRLVSTGVTTGFLGQTIPVQFTLENVGTASSGPFLYAVYLSRDNDVITRQDTRVFLSENTTLAPGESRRVLHLVPVPASLEPGVYFAGLIADAAGRVQELDRTNNVAAAPAPVVISAPTADIVAASVTAQTQAAAGSRMRVSAVLANLGTLAATFPYALYLSDNDLASPNDLLLAEGVLTLAPGGQQVVTFDVEVPPTLEPGAYRVALIADPGRTLPDAAPGNNVAMAPEPLQVLAPALSVLNTQLPDALVDVAYEVQLGTRGGAAPARWSLAGGRLPGGLALSETGLLSGVPAETGVFALVVEASSAELKAMRALTLAVREYAASLGLNETALPQGRRGVFYDQHVGASGGSGQYAFSLQRGTLPPGLALDKDGRVSGFPVSAGAWTFTVAVQDEAGQRAQGEVTLEVVAEGALTLLSTRLREAEVSRVYTATLPIEGGQAPYDAGVIEGQLPPGLALGLDVSGVALELKGTPAHTGVYAFAIVVGDSRGERVMEHLVLQVTARRLSFITTQLPTASRGQSYSALIEANARAPFAYTVAGGELPPGLSLAEGGEVSGTVASDAPPRLYAFAVRVTDAQGGEALAAFAIDVPAPQLARDAGGSGCSSSGSAGLLAAFALAFVLALRRRRAAVLGLVVAVVTGSALPAEAYYRLAREQAPFVPLAAGDSRTTLLSTEDPDFNQTSVTTRGRSVPLPFPFKFYGVEQTSVGVTSKGLLSFGTISLSGSYNEATPLPGVGGPSQFVAPLWGYLQLSDTTPTTPSLVSYRIEGAEPRRVLAVEWRNMQSARTSDPAGKGKAFAAYSFQVRLHEGTNEISIHYGGDAVLLGKTPPLTFAMGIEGVDGAQGVDASDSRCSPGCTPADFPINTVVRFQVVPDVSITALQVPESLFEGVEATIRAEVLNSGDNDAPRVVVRYALSTDRFLDDGDIVFGDSPATTIVAGASATIGTRVTVPEGTRPGVYYLLARVDPDDELVELDETNNDFEPPQVVVQQRAPEFVPVRLIGPNAVDAGQPFQITRTIRNEGNAPGSGHYRVVLSANPLASSADLTLEEGSFTLQPGESLDLSPHLTVPSTVTPGPYYLGLLVRAAQGQAELNPLNNDRVFGPMVVRGNALAITRESLPTLAAGAPFSLQLTAQGGSGSYVWTEGVPGLPPGVRLSEGGVLSGQVETTGEWAVQVRVSSLGATVSRVYTLRARGVQAPLTVVSRRLPIAQLATPFEAYLAAQGGEPPYEWALTGQSALPPGVVLSADGVLEGVPLADGRHRVHVQVRDASGQRAQGEVELPIAGPTRPLFASADLPPARLGQAYDARVVGAGGAAPYRFSVVDTRRVPTSPTDETRYLVGQLPPGLSLEENGRVGGVPTLAGVYVVTMRLVDARANDATAQFALAIGSGDSLSVRTRALPDARLGEPYEAALTAVGADGELSWEIQLPEGGTLPPGLVFVADGRLVGTPLEVGQVSFLVIARDAAGQSAVQPLALRVGHPPAPEKDKAGGCSQTGPAGLGALLALAALLWRRRRAPVSVRAAGPLVAVLVAGGMLAGCTPQQTSACVESCEAPFTCDENDGLCKCGGEGGAICTAGETCDADTRSCLAATCESGCASPLVCGDGGLCRCGSASGPVCGAGEACSAFGRCEKVSRCEGVVCSAGMACNPDSGACECGAGGERCGAGERCVDAACVADRCLGVACSGGTSCDPADGLCKCGGPGGAVCAGGEACEAFEARCVRSSRCEDVQCGVGSSCDPADGLCKCGGPGGPVCGDGQSCDPIGRRCVGGDRCAQVQCSDGLSCDPEDGLCKCGGYGGAVCSTAQACVVKGPQARCEQTCDVTSKTACGEGRACRWDNQARLAYCVAAGSANEGQSCGAEAGACAAGLHCMGETPTQSGVCRAYCRLEPGCASSAQLCLPFQSDNPAGACVPYAAP